MKKVSKTQIFIVLSLTFLLTCLTAPHLNRLLYAGEKLNLAVAEFEARNVSQMDAVTISDFLRTELVKTGVFNVVERNNMQKILAEQKFQMTGCTTQECAVKMGQILNVQRVIIGEFGKFLDAYYVNISMVDVETSQIVYADKVSCKSTEDVEKGIEDLVSKLIKKYGVEKKEGVEIKKPESEGPSIVRTIIQGKSVAINRGFHDDVRTKSIFLVHEGEKEIGRLFVTWVDAGESIAEVVESVNYDEIHPGKRIKLQGRYRPNSVGMAMGFGLGKDTDMLMAAYNFYYDYFLRSGWGMQGSLGIFGGVKEEYKENSQVREDTSVAFLFPLTGRFYFARFSQTPCYLGFGLCLATYYWEPYQRSGTYGTDWILIPGRQSETHIAPLLNAGVNFFGLSPFHITLDWRLFIGKNFRGMDTTIFVSSLGLSYNW